MSPRSRLHREARREILQNNPAQRTIPSTASARTTRRMGAEKYLHTPFEFSAPLKNYIKINNLSKEPRGGSEPPHAPFLVPAGANHYSRGTAAAWPAAWESREIKGLCPGRNASASRRRASNL